MRRSTPATASVEAAEYRQFYKTEGFKLALLEARDKGCWVVVETPDEERFPVDPDDVEYEAGRTLYRDDIGTAALCAGGALGVDPGAALLGGLAMDGFRRLTPVG